MQEIRVKLSDEIVEQIEELAKKRGVSKTDIVRDAVLYYLGISDAIGKQVESSDAKIVTAMFTSRCRRCGREIHQGDLIGLIRIKFEGEEKPRSFVYCLDCYYSVTDKTIVQLELKRVKLQKTVQALRREINKLVSLYEELEREVNLMNKIKEITTMLELYLERVYRGENVDIKKLIHELTELNLNLSDFLRAVNVKKKMYAKYTSTYATRE